MDDLRKLTAMMTLSLMISAHWPSSLQVSPAAGARGTVASSCRRVMMVGSVLDMGEECAKLEEAKVEAVVFVDLQVVVTGTTKLRLARCCNHPDHPSCRHLTSTRRP